MCNTPLAILCAPDEEGAVVETLQRPQKGLGRIEWDGIEFHLAHGERIDLLRANELEVERLVELYAPDDAVDHEYYDGVGVEWAKRWPAEEIWMARKAPLVGADLRSAGFAGAPSAPLTPNDRNV